MNDIEAIRARISRRTFDTNPLTQVQRAGLSDAIAEANRQGALSCRLVTDRPDLFGGFSKTYGLFQGVRHFVILAGSRDHADLFETCGFHGERIVLEAVKLGLGTCWVGGSFDKASVAGLVGTDDRLTAVIAVGNVPPVMRLRDRLIRTATHLRRRDADWFSETDGTEPPWFAEAIDLVAAAPSALNRRPVRFHAAGGVLTCSLRIRDDAALIDLGIAKLHFNAACPAGRWSPGERGVFTQP